MNLFFLCLLSQITFAVIRTLNITFVANNNLFWSIVTGVANAMMCVLTTKLGIDAMNSSGADGLIGYGIGAAAGTGIAMRWKEVIFFAKNFNWGIAIQARAASITNIGDRWVVRFESGSEYGFDMATTSQRDAVMSASKQEVKFLKNRF